MEMPVFLNHLKLICDVLRKTCGQLVGVFCSGELQFVQLRCRLRVFGEVPKMRCSVFLFGLLLLVTAGCAEIRNPLTLKPGVAFDLHAVAEEPGDNTKAIADSSGTPLQLIVPPIITASNVREVTVSTDRNGTVALNVSVDAAGAAMLRAATTNPGSQVALVVDGEIVSAPVIHSQISDEFQIAGPYSESDWEKLIE